MAYSLGRSPFANATKMLDEPKLIMVTHPVYMWNDSFDDNGITLIDVVETGGLLILLSINPEKSNSSNLFSTSQTTDCLVLSQKGKFGWALIDIEGIICLEGDLDDIFS